MRLMSGLAVMLCASVCACAEDAVRHTVWSGFNAWLTQGGNGFSVPATNTTDWKGFVAEGKQIRGENEGDSFAYTFDRAGTLYFGVILSDDPDGVERLSAALNGKTLGVITADRSGGIALCSFPGPIEVKSGDRLTFTCETFVGYYRISKLVFSKRPLVPPPPEFDYIEARSAEPGSVSVFWTTNIATPTGRVEYGADGFTSSTQSDATLARNHRVLISNLDADVQYQARIVTKTVDGVEASSKPFTMRGSPAVPPVTKPLTLPLMVGEPTKAPRRGWSATVGMPFAKGSLRDTQDLRLFDAQGNPVSLQADCTCRWPDNSVKWATLTFLADSALGDSTPTYRLEARLEWPDAQEISEPLVHIAESQEGWTLTADRLAMVLHRNAPVSIEIRDIDLDGDGKIGDSERNVFSSKGTSLEVTTDSGRTVTCGAVSEFSVEENGSCRAVFCWSGALEDSPWSYTIRATVWRGQTNVKYDVSIVNNSVDEPVFKALKSVSFCLSADEGDVTGSVEGRPMSALSADKSVRVVQDRDYQFSVVEGGQVTTGERAIGVAALAGARTQTMLFLCDFREMYPSALEATVDGMRAGLMPELKPDTYSDDESKKRFSVCYPWFKDGDYLIRSGQMNRRTLYVAYGASDSHPDAAQYAAWFNAPLFPMAPPEYLCGTGVLGCPIYARTSGVWDAYETQFEQGFALLNADREKTHYYGWMNYGDWYGERGSNAGNNEYDLAWAMAVQWMRTGDRRYFERGLQMARHYATVDTLHGTPAAEKIPCLVWQHSFNHVGSCQTPQELFMDEKVSEAATTSMAGYFQGKSDPQGHVYEEGLWLYGQLTGDAFLRKTADRVCDGLAQSLTSDFDFSIERGGGWPLINMTAACEFSSNPYYLNAARIMVQRCLERHDPVTGAWSHTPPLSETNGKPVIGGKPFAAGILTYGLLHYLEVEPLDRPDVRKMLVRSVDWLKDEAWIKDKGFVYITNAPEIRDSPSLGYVCALNADAVAFAYEETKDSKYLEFWKEMMANHFERPSGGMGKSFSQNFRQTVFGLARLRVLGVTQ
ncbi:MAG: fibronectin type III domain-containing protein [Candidatus Hydrogenedentes bacterium]|nr:fibronectin type III domain-containing protein [Candidatus Hydrogenedentota bacterium]